MNDSLGDRMKAYEAAETNRRFMPLLPIYARIDGRAFHNFTKGMKKPFDPAMTDCMVKTTIALVRELGATVGYTQSDEISLVWKNDNIDSDMPFGGKIFKLNSIIPALATSYFSTFAFGPFGHLMISKRPVFDTRIFQLPNLMEASNVILWRVNDAVKNSISMAARAHFSHKELQGKKGPEMHEMMYHVGTNWANYPQSFKEGTFVKRTSYVMKTISPEAAEKLGPDASIVRTTVSAMQWPPFKSIQNKVDVLFNDAEPIVNNG